MMLTRESMELKPGDWHMKTKHIKINTGIDPDQRRISRYRQVWKGALQESFFAHIDGT